MQAKFLRPRSALLALFPALLAPGVVSAQSHVCWPEEVELSAADSDQIARRFGWTLDVDADTAIVGTPSVYPSGSAGWGAAYVFRNAGSGWQKEAKLVPGDAAAGMSFGTSVALLGDLALIGAENEGGTPTMGGPGAAYLFARSGTAWTQQAKLTASDGVNGDNFGNAVAFDTGTAVVGAWTASSGAGAVYVFGGGGSTWTENAKLAANESTSAFGHSVDVRGATVLVGAPNLPVTGAAYVFSVSGTNWSQLARLTASDAGSGDKFGFSCSLGDGTALIGANGWDLAASNEGAAYVFVGSGSAWSQQAQLLPADPENLDQFGVSTSLSGDLALVGATQSAPRTGKAYIFEREGSTWGETARLLPSDGGSGDVFGWAVAVSGSTAMVGAYNHDHQFVNDGGVYVYEGVPAPLFYCTGKTSSVACIPFLSVAGRASATDTGNFTITANDVVPSESGFVIYSFKKSNLDYHGGKLCVKSPITRTPAKAAVNTGGGCSGWVLRRNFNATIQSGNDPALTPGQLVFAQWRQRDPADPAGFGDALSDGVRFTICP